MGSTGASIASLPHDFAALICDLLPDNARDALATRLAMRPLLEPGARVLRTLVAERADPLPARAWSTFSSADGLVVQIDGAPREQLHARLQQQLAASLPERLQRLCIQRPTGGNAAWWQQLRGSAIQLVASLVDGSPCVGSLRRVHIHVPVCRCCGGAAGRPAQAGGLPPGGGGGSAGPAS